MGHVPSSGRWCLPNSQIHPFQITVGGPDGLIGAEYRGHPAVKGKQRAFAWAHAFIFWRLRIITIDGHQAIGAGLGNDEFTGEYPPGIVGLHPLPTGAGSPSTKTRSP